jgi:putative transposase
VTLPVSRGYDAGKKVNGRKRFVVTNALGLLLTVLVVPAGRQDRDGALQLLVDLYFTHWRCRHLFADGGFAGRFVDWARDVMKTTVEIVRKKPGQRGFEALPKRWVVERTLCAARRSVVFPAQLGGTWREVPGSDG